VTPPAPGVPGAGESTPGGQARSGPDDTSRAASDAWPVGRERIPFWGPAASWLLFRALWPTRVHDAQLVPDRGPVLFASNHIGVLDGPMLVAVAPRFVHCLVKQEMFRGPIAVILRSAQQIPVDRGRGDRGALGTALALLAAGGTVGVFPEGTRGRGDVGEVRQGIAWLALRSGAPVVPVACLGTRRTGEPTTRPPWPGRRLDVVFGEPITLTAQAGVPGRVALAEASATLRDTMAAHVMRAQTRTGQSLPEDLGWTPDEIARGEHL
jgi:1-acyl-sn-glycerol-3-phosphate acyltransferase